MRRIGLPALMFSIGGAAMLVIAVIVLWYDLRALSWPPVEATVVSSRVLGDQGGMYSAERVFRYKIMDREWTVTDSSSLSSSSYDFIHKTVEEYPAGSRRMVRVEPGHPTELSTRMQFSADALLIPGVLALMAVIFGGIGAVATLFDLDPVWFAQWRRHRQARKSAPDPNAWLRYVGYTFGSIGIVFLVISAFMAKSQLMILRTWPAVDATVTRSGVTGGMQGSRGARYTSWVEFRYAARDSVFVTPTSSNVYSSNRSSAEEDSAFFAAGSHHEIRIHPQRPEIVRYDVHASVWFFIFPLAMLGGAVVFGFFGVMCLKFLPSQSPLRRWRSKQWSKQDQSLDVEL